jgi:hypothetical protein
MRAREADRDVGRPVTAPDDDASRFRTQAEEARLQAEKAISPLDKEAWLKLAGEWIKRAQQVDGRHGRR